jgi:membrane protease YdiL (CAAX protease family)
MSFFVAAMWSVSATLLTAFIELVLMSARHTERLDVVTHVLSEGVAFLATLYLIVIVHDADRPLSDVLALRKTRVSLCVVAAVLGLALHGPLTLISDVIESRYPRPEDEIESLRWLLTAPALHQKIALVASAGIFGPVVEEMFFRGGILRNLRRVHPSGLTLLGTSLLFAAAHLDPRNFLPIFLGGLAMGYVRILSGSIWPAILLHATFNTASVIVAVILGPDAPDPLTRPQALVGVGATLGLVALFGSLALRSELCSEAREQDLT